MPAAAARIANGVEALDWQTKIGAWTFAAVLALGTHRAGAQAMLADDIIILSKGQRAQEKARTETHLGASPGAGGGPLRSSPGAPESRLGERPGASGTPPAMPQRDVLSAAASEGRLPEPLGPPGRAPTRRQPGPAVRSSARWTSPAATTRAPPTA